MSVSTLAKMAQASDESHAEYLYRFKITKNWCKVLFPEKEYVRLAQNHINIECQKKFIGMNFRDMNELAENV